MRRDERVLSQVSSSAIFGCHVEVRAQFSKDGPVRAGRLDASLSVLP